MSKKQQQTDAEALKQWRGYMNRKAPQVIYPAPANLAENGKIVVAPAEKPDWWMGGFSDKKSARKFCKQNGLPFTEHDVQPSAS